MCLKNNFVLFPEKIANFVFATIFLIFIFFPYASIAADTTLVPKNKAWKYLDDGSNQAAAWSAPSFDDSSWVSGPAQLGYGDGDEATVVSFGPDSNNKFITTYFRHTFNVADISSFVTLTLQLLRDDGAVVYLNGSEIHRSNMPGGNIDYTTIEAKRCQE